MKPMFLSFFTPDYEECALELGKDCQRLGVDFQMTCIDKFHSWMEATYGKAFFIKSALETIGGDSDFDGIVWIDADARMRARPEFLYTLDPVRCDIAAHIYNERELLSGTVWFANNAKCREVVDTWCAYNSGEISCLEQKNLDHAIKDTKDVRFVNLDPALCYIFDLSKRVYPDLVPIIEHFQRSRQTRRKERLCQREGR
jgi:hypothetical protein